jgi:protein subunit release factor A
VQEAFEWAKFAEEDPSAEAIAEDLRATAATLLRDLKATVPCAAPLGERDCVIELRSTHAQITGYQASVFEKFANAHGLEVHFLADEEHLCILEVKGWLALGHFAHLNGKMNFVPPKAWFNASHLFGEITLTVYPLWKERELDFDYLDDLRWDKYRNHGRCCFCSRDQRNVVRVFHPTSGIQIELFGHEKEYLLKQKALQLLISQLRYRRFLEANNAR